MMLVNGLPRAIHARFETEDRDTCLDGTRTELLKQIYGWIQNEERPRKRQRLIHDVDDKRPGDISISGDFRPIPSIFWINGSPGTGKMTIASTVAKECKDMGILGASFFCSRDDAECSNPKLIFPAIAQQLGLFSPSFQAELATVLTSKPDIVYSRVCFQLEELIINPLRRLGNRFPSCIVVMDALDECRDHGTTSVILSSLSRFVADLRHLKFLITSRPEQQIASVFRSSQLQHACRPLFLHDVALPVVQCDIERYLDFRLKEIRTAWRIRGHPRRTFSS
jgi:hypothetical protein